MEEQYGMGDLRQYIDGWPLFPAIPQPPDLPSCHRALSSSYPYDMLIFCPSDSTALAPSDGYGAAGFEAEAGAMGDGGTGRWPRQETLTLLEIRSRLDPKFKEANQKIPLWDEVARVMLQEYGYQRSGKKCREKFENLYKYYKKTKEGKAGRQDGKHYRFFRQLEALYGDAATTSAATHFHTPYNDQELRLPDSCECDPATSSYCTDSDAGGYADEDEARMRKRKGKMRIMKAKIEAQMRSITEKQEAWMEKMTKVIEGKEQERLMREEQWHRQDAARIDSEHKMWAAEKAWIETRDAALMDAFNKLAGREIEIEVDHRRPPPPQLLPESEVTRLIQLRSGMELRFDQESGVGEEAAWDEIAAKMAACGGAGGNRSGGMCSEKWDHVIGDYLIKCSKKRKEGNAGNGSGCNYSYDQNRDPIILSDHGGSAANANDGPFRFFIGDSYQRL